MQVNAETITSVGQVPYESRVSGNQENLPIAGSIAGAHGKRLLIATLDGHSHELISIELEQAAT